MPTIIFEHHAPLSCVRAMQKKKKKRPVQVKNCKTHPLVSEPLLGWKIKPLGAVPSQIGSFHYSDGDKFFIKAGFEFLVILDYF